MGVMPANIRFVGALPGGGDEPTEVTTLSHIVTTFSASLDI